MHEPIKIRFSLCFHEQKPNIALLENNQPCKLQNYHNEFLEEFEDGVHAGLNYIQTSLLHLVYLNAEVWMSFRQAA